MRHKYSILLFLSLFFIACSSNKETAKVNSVEKTNQKTVADLPEKEQIEFNFLFLNASKERILGNYEVAANLFNQCIQMAGKEPAPYYELANIFDLAKSSELFLEYAEKAVKLDGENYWYKILYAHALQNSGNMEKAIVQYEELIQTTPENIDLYYDLASMQLYSKQYKDAIESLNKIEQKMGVSEELTLQKVKVYVKLNDLEKAAKEIEKLILFYPNEMRYRGELADLYMANNLPEKAFEVLEKILEVDPNNPYANLSLYDYYKNKGQNEEAFQAVKKAFQSPELGIDAKMQILLSYYSATESDNSLKKEAFELNKVLIETHPNDAKSYTIYADFLYREKKLEGAKENYLKAIEHDNSKFAIWSQLILIESELQDQESIMRDSKRAIDLFPNQPIFYFFYGATNLQKKNYKEAVDYLLIGKDYVLDNPPLLAQFYASLGDAYNGLKEYVKSDEVYEKALKIEPKNIYVLNNYSYYLSLRGEKLERAEQLSGLCNEIEPDQSNYQDTYAWILYKQGKFVQARDWLEKALKNGGGNNAVIIEHLGDVYAQLKDLDKALELWIKAKGVGEGTELLDKKIADKQLYE
ncbi:MAG: tetratricopeptide repeat protein [Vicingus serpentipes]|nr:tetratricopeptide repeat protein [Vicingus serpentipes]